MISAMHSQITTSKFPVHFSSLSVIIRSHTPEHLYGLARPGLFIEFQFLGIADAVLNR
jgi:hypothetical protein